MTTDTALDVAVEQPNDADASTVREYLAALLAALWDEGEMFDSKRPFGNGNWRAPLYHALGEAGHIPVYEDAPEAWGVVYNEEAGDRMIAAAIRELGGQ